MRMFFIVVVAVLLVACSGSEPVTVAPTSTTTPEATQTIIPTSTVGATTSPIPTSSGTPAVTVTPAPAPPAATPPAPRPGDATGAPFSTVDVRVAVEDGRGYSFWLVDERASLCPASAVPGHSYWSANLAGSDFGPVFTLWVYPDVDALKQDWQVDPGQAPLPRFDCELPSGFVYWNENLVMAFDVWLSLGEPMPLESHWESPRDMPAVQAFLELAPR